MMEVDNGLRLDTIKSNVPEFNTIKILDDNSLMLLAKEKFGREGFCVLYLDYKVLIGRYDGERFLFYQNEIFKSRFIQKMRLFNNNKELYLWRKNRAGFGWRLRVDDSGEETDIVDAMQVLWGTKSEQKGNFNEIFEERGTKIILPFKGLEVNNQDKRVFLWTRNYVSYETNSDYKQAGYADCRFVGFKNGNLSNGNIIFSELK